MKAYKGFDKDLKCRGFQYEIGKEYHEDNADLCQQGFHACEYPLDCFGYYLPAESRYCVVEIDDNGQRNSDDTKICGKHIKIIKEISINDLIQEAFTYIKSCCTSKQKGQDRSAIQGGDHSAIQGGDRSAIQGGYRSAIQGGDWSALLGGYRSALLGGDRSALLGGDRSAIQGGYGSAIQCGDRSAIQGGNWSALLGGDRSAIQGGTGSVIYGGEGAKVRGGLHSVLAIQYWKDGDFQCIKFKEVDGEKIKPDTWYKLDKAGRFIEVKNSAE